MKKDHTKKLVVRPGTMKTWKGGRWASIYCSIKLTQDGRLSISGVIGPLPSGNALGACGQIDMEFHHRNPAHNDKRYDNPTRPSDIRFRPGWTVTKWYQFLDDWKTYHLNDMHAGCKHQTAEDWGKKEIKRVTAEFKAWKIRNKGHRERMVILRPEIDFIEKALTPQGIRAGNIRTFEGRLFANVKIAALEGKVFQPTGKAEKSWFDGGVIEIKTETKTSGWVHPGEHPDGELTKPCPTCGYKYGTAWNKSEVPADVLAWLFSLPPADQKPAWV